MKTIHLKIASPDKELFDDHVNMVIAPGSEGQLGILPNHTALFAKLTYGALIAKRAHQPDQVFAIECGFMEVQPDQVIVLADSAEQVCDIDLKRAEAAYSRAERRLKQKAPEKNIDHARAEAALHRAINRIKLTSP
jgi:F-type H+-transporting ATPase subunit epsilon